MMLKYARKPVVLEWRIGALAFTRRSSPRLGAIKTLALQDHSERSCRGGQLESGRKNNSRIASGGRNSAKATNEGVGCRSRWFGSSRSRRTERPSSSLPSLRVTRPATPRSLPWKIKDFKGKAILDALFEGRPCSRPPTPRIRISETEGHTRVVRWV